MKLFFQIIFLLSVNLVAQIKQSGIIIDSDMTFEESIKGINIPESIRNNLVLIEVQYFSFDEKLHQGQLVVHKSVAKDLQEIFEIIRELKFPVQKVIPVSAFGWNDETSMQSNNTSCFNYRKTKGTNVLSYHAKGLAIDINPLQNPHIINNKSFPSGAIYDKTKSGTLTDSSQIVKEFKRRGWIWGGNWRSSKDYQHFEKRTN